MKSPFPPLANARGGDPRSKSTRGGEPRCGTGAREDNPDAAANGKPMLVAR